MPSTSIVSSMIRNSYSQVDDFSRQWGAGSNCCCSGKQNPTPANHCHYGQINYGLLAHEVDYWLDGQIIEQSESPKEPRAFWKVPGRLRLISNMPAKIRIFSPAAASPTARIYARSRTGSTHIWRSAQQMSICVRSRKLTAACKLILLVPCFMYFNTLSVTEW